MIYQIFNPAPALSDIIEHYWYSKVELTGSPVQYYATPLLQGLTFNFQRQEEHHTYHNNTIDLYKQAHFFGQPTCPRTITRNEKNMEMLGVKFKPLGIVKITGINMEHAVDGIIPAEDIWGSEFESLWDKMQSASSIEQSVRVLEAFFLSKFQKTKLHYRVDNVQNALSVIKHSNSLISIKDLQKKTNISRKTLERAFTNYLGLTPKIYTQITRFNAAKELIDRSANINIPDIAFKLGYYDTSHFNGSFKRFSGLMPTEYIKNRQEGSGLFSFCPFFPKRHLVQGRETVANL